MNFFLLLISLIIAAATCASAFDQKTDAAALCDFFNTVPAAGKAKLTNWCKNQAPCDDSLPWYGVSCTATGRVEVLAIEDIGGGKLPPSWGNMDQLIMISMYADGLTGGIPNSLGNLKKLDKLWLNENKFTGPIPASLCNLPKTADIDFYENSAITCYPQCLSSRPYFMTHGRGKVSKVCPADGGASLPPTLVDNCDAAAGNMPSCPPGKRAACEGGKWVCHGDSATASAPPPAPTKPVTATAPKCPDSKWKALAGYSPLRCSAPRGYKSCPGGWKKIAPATTTKGVTCSKGSAPTRAPTPAPYADDATGSYYGQ